MSITLELATQKHRDVLQSLSAQMSLVNSIFNPWVYCALSRPYRKAYIYVLRRVGRVCGIKQSRPADIMALNDMSSRLPTSSKLTRLYRTPSDNSHSIAFFSVCDSLKKCILQIKTMKIFDLLTLVLAG